MKAKTPDAGEVRNHDGGTSECGSAETQNPGSAETRNPGTDTQECGGTSKSGSGGKRNNAGEALFRERAERIVNERIRPALNLHDGDMSIQDTRGGEIWVAFAGACHGCPSAQITLEEVVGQIFAEELGADFKAVHLVNNVDEDLLNFARHLLDKNKK